MVMAIKSLIAHTLGHPLLSCPKEQTAHAQPLRSQGFTAHSPPREAWGVWHKARGSRAGQERLSHVFLNVFSISGSRRRGPGLWGNAKTGIQSPARDTGPRKAALTWGHRERGHQGMGQACLSGGQEG